jgi:hypothetical protein
MRNFSEIPNRLHLGEMSNFTPGDQGERDKVLATEASPRTPSEAPSPSSTETAPKQASASELLRKIARHKPTTYDIRTLNFPDSDDEEMSRES